MAQEAIRLCRVETGMGTVDLMHARYVTQVFVSHFHENYCLYVIEPIGTRSRGNNQRFHPCPP